MALAEEAEYFQLHFALHIVKVILLLGLLSHVSTLNQIYNKLKELKNKSLLYDHYYVLKSLHCTSIVTEIHKMMRVRCAECRLNVLPVQAKQKTHLSNGIDVI